MRASATWSMLALAQSLVVLLLSLALASASDPAAIADTPGSAKTYRLRGMITSNDILPDPSVLATTARVVVNGGEHTAFIQSDGGFSVDNLGLGHSLFEIAAANYSFPKIHIHISLNDQGRAAIAARYVQPGADWSEDAPVLSYPLRVAATAKYDFYTPRQGFSIVAMFSNPYMMMVGASLVAVFLLPKLQANIDPEILDEMNKKTKG
ncbi:hypothetical protein GGI15_001353 [Coemansia interrupta]|uniref:ER membrane protein complex subunit 7 beta-sandwich domain-containing protein n=1 Tax=Coemansia interrupta TaxID=1126814 RepID=A0A9W8HJR2_9FUNG|nr:hypothetical protein GGI15_001353 [Coemansia interrupta]